MSAALLWVLAAGFGKIPALGPALDAGRGVWTSAAGGRLPRSGTLDVAGLRRPVTVMFTARGVAAVRADSDHDAFVALGYLHARFRLVQMDLERRVGEGRLAQLAGPADVPADEFDLRLGLLRTARREWADTPRSSRAAQALLAYSQGVNDGIGWYRRTGNWPALFTLTGVYPTRWTPVDSLVIQGVLTEELDFTTTPLDYALLDRSLGRAKTMAWFPVNPPNAQSPYDPGPYRNLGVTPLPPDAASSAGTAGGGQAAGSSPTDGRGTGPVAAGVVTAAGSLLAQINRMPDLTADSGTGTVPVGAGHRYPASNAWAVNGPKAAGGGALLAGDPHLPLTLPSIWYQVALSAPGLAVSGVTVPGVPGVLIGHNQHVAWSETDVQNQSTMFYAEKTSRDRPDEYYWRGAWRPMRRIRYTIPVRGARPVHLTVDVTVHGPIMTQAGQTLAVDWMGNVDSPDLAALLGVDEAGDAAQLRAALADWHAPTLNFVYATDRGDIGAIAAGYYPQVGAGCQPWLPLPGTGGCDVVGVIPYPAVPQVANPPGHVVASANQRPVTASYPYYIGTTADAFDNGFRANEIDGYLAGRSGVTAAGFAGLQTSVTDYLAGQIVPKLLAALGGARLSGRERAAARLLAGWNDAMDTGSAAASLWWTFWGDYVSTVFRPWWTADRVPVRKDPLNLALSSLPTSLTEDLAAWTLTDPTNPALRPPGGARRTAAEAMRTAFGAAVSHLAAKLGGPPAAWTWGRLHSRVIPSVTGAAALGYGPRPAGGDPWTVNAAEGGMESSVGPSWRMIVQFAGSGGAGSGGTGGGAVRSLAVYPGGQSENPASPWYDDDIAAWWDGRYLPMPPAAGQVSDPIRWLLRPGALARPGERDG